MKDMNESGADAPLRIGVLGVAHMHCWSYVAIFKGSTTATMVGFYEPDDALADAFAAGTGTRRFTSRDELLAQVEAVCVCSENAHHRKYVMAALDRGLPALCEKPLATTLEDAEAMVAAAEAKGIALMTAFPCRFSPAFQQLKAKITAGAIGRLKALRTTNRGRCPFGWFVETEKSGGGAMIDHTVHVADLLLDLLGEEPARVEAKIGNQIHEQKWEDTAMLTLDYDSGLFATLDSSWSRPSNFKTWGDVTIEAIGDEGVLSMNLFGETLLAYRGGDRFGQVGYGADLDRMMAEEFASAVKEKRTPMVTGRHGLAALKVALKAYASIEALPT